MLNSNFELWNLRQYEYQRRGISLSTEGFVGSNRNAILACNILRSFVDHSSTTNFTLTTQIIQKNRRVNFEWKFNTFRN